MDQSILSKEEYKLFGHILEYIKNFNNISVMDSIQKQLKEIDEREKNFCNEFILKKEKKEIELEEVLHSKLKNLSNDIIEEISSSIHKLKKEKIEIETLNIFFNNLQKIQNDYLEKISKIEKEHNAEIQYNNKICNTEIGALKEGYANMRKSLEDSMDKDLIRSIDSKKTLIFDKNNRLGEMATLFLTCYNFNKTRFIYFI
jgi:hypothetical protein